MIASMFQYSRDHLTLYLVIFYVFITLFCVGNAIRTTHVQP